MGFLLFNFHQHLARFFEGLFHIILYLSLNFVIIISNNSVIIFSSTILTLFLGLKKRISTKYDAVQVYHK